MSASVLVSGKLFRDVERKTSREGKPFVSFTLREGNGETAAWWKVVSFSPAVVDELSTCREGDGIAVSGDLKAEAYAKDGEQKVRLTCFANRAITARHEKPERAPRDKGRSPASSSRQRPLGLPRGEGQS